jgi:hypothetical protein
MKFFIILAAFCLTTLVYSQPAHYIAVKAGPSGSSEEADLELFHLNHVLYTKACMISNIHSSISAEDMAVITEAVHVNLGVGKLTRFMITTQQKVPYQLSVAVFQDQETKAYGLVILTNFNPKKGKFEKKPNGDHYATWCPLEENVVTGGIFASTMDYEEKAREENDYITLLNMHVFNTICDSAEMHNWFALAEETQPDKINNRNMLKTYYHMSKYNFDESEAWLKELRKSVATFSVEEQNWWAAHLAMIQTEIKALKLVKEG